MVLILFFLLIVVSLSSIQQRPQNQTPPSNLATEDTERIQQRNKDVESYLLLNKIVLNKTTRNEAKEILRGWNQEAINDITTITTPTSLPSRTNKVVSNKQFVIYKRVIIPLVITESKEVTISGLKNSLGEPHQTYTGSKAYGYSMATYAYPQKGISFVANNFEDEVYEIQYFQPTTLDEFIKLYGEDINLSEPIISEPETDIPPSTPEPRWINQLPFYDPTYSVEYDENRLTIIATIFTIESFSIPKKEQEEYIKNQILERLDKTGVNTSEQKIEWRVY